MIYIRAFWWFSGKESACTEADAVLTLGREDSLEGGMATYSRILAWRISWIEEPGKLQTIGSQRAGQD